MYEQGKHQAAAGLGTNFWKMPLPQKAAFLYGSFLVVKNIVEYWEK